MKIRNLLITALILISAPLLYAESAPGGIDRCNVVWDSPVKDCKGSMPVGNGDIALNLWVEENGDLVIYIAKSDAFSENGVIQKIGRVHVKFTPGLCRSGAPFREELRLRDGEIVIRGGSGQCALETRVWVDANHPVIHVDTTGDKSFSTEASLDLWRNQTRTVDSKSPEMGEFYELIGSPKPVVIDPDTVLPGRGDRVTWFHRNERSIYPDVLTNQHLESLAGSHPDPLLHRTYGACMIGKSFAQAGDRSLRSASATESNLVIHVLTAQTDTAAEWQTMLDNQIAETEKTPREEALKENRQWWADFWNRSWITVSGTKDADVVTSGYALQRWVCACAGRGALPIKFNGSLFTVNATMSDRATKQPVPLDADYRTWGSSYWFQNTRLIYWPFLASGDYDLMEPFFKMYLDALPLARDRTAHDYTHAGTFFNETMSFWGLPNNKNYGWKNPGPETVNPYIRRYWQGGIELVAMMLRRFANTQEENFASRTLLPLAVEITTFYDRHWPRDATGKIRFAPAQSLETWQTAVNPLPDIAGLHFILPQLLALPERLTTDAQRAMWKKMLADLPPVPVREVSRGNSRCALRIYGPMGTTWRTPSFTRYSPTACMAWGAPISRRLATHTISGSSARRAAGPRRAWTPPRLAARRRPAMRSFSISPIRIATSDFPRSGVPDTTGRRTRIMAVPA